MTSAGFDGHVAPIAMDGRRHLERLHRENWVESEKLDLLGFWDKNRKQWRLIQRIAMMR